MIRLRDIFVGRPGRTEAGSGLSRFRTLAARLRRIPGHHLRALAIAAGLLATVGSSLSNVPHSLAYFNEASGGSENGHKHLLGSNFDWNQNLLILREWIEGGNVCKVGFLGWPHRYDRFYNPTLLGIKCHRLPDRASGQDVAQPIQSGATWYAISANWYYRHWNVATDHSGLIELPNGTYTKGQRIRMQCILGRTVYIFVVE